ncbi:MAG TPA: hypothetical protein VFV27_09845 [Nevskiaceae bacterium]|nr:hypothetical protein [Nevskiaceae bacterium]
MKTLPPLGLSLLALALAGCAGSGAAPEAPRYNRSAGTAAQASQFVTAQHLAGAAPQKVGITACNVLFATRTGASAATSAGLFNTSSNRVEAKVSSWYYLQNLDDAAMQALTERICDGAEQRLSAQGLSVVPRAQLAASAELAPLLAKGEAAPYEWKDPASKTEYRIFAPGGLTVQGFGNALGNAFAIAGGDSPAQLEFLAGRAGGYTPVQLSVVVDFASVSGDGQRALGGLADKNSAEVQASVALSVSGSLKLMSPGLFECMPRLGKEYCYQKSQQIPQVVSQRPLVAEETFYSEIADIQSTAEKVGEGVANVIGLLGGGLSFSQSKNGVKVIPEVYTGTAERYALDFVEMAALQLPR